MSDLQISLLVLGVIVVAGVYAFNWLQERGHRKRAESAFSAPRHDVLMDQGERTPETFDIQEEAPPAELPPEPAKVEPRPAPVSRTSRIVSEPDENPIDHAVVLSADVPVSQAALDDLASVTASLSRPVRLYGSQSSNGGWQLLAEDGGERWHHVKVALQLVDRQGVATRSDIEHINNLMTEVAARIGAVPTLPDAAKAAAQAQALDALCADVDIAIGISVVAGAGQTFQGTTIRALAEADGLRLQADGVFHSGSGSGLMQFTLDNQDPEPFFPETIRGLTTSGITFLLDVPRAGGGLAAFDRMVQVAQQFARSLDGTLVDDDRQPLNDAGIEATRRALAAVFATMESRGIAPGGPVALRLFS
jgi:hypothetical protein